MRILKAAVLMGFVLFAGWSAVYGGMADEPVSTVPSIPQKQFDAYIEASRLISADPGMTREEVELLLKKNQLSTEEYESIDQQVQTNPDLKQKVEEHLQQVKSGQKETQEPSDVRTKLKEPSPETPAK